MPRTVPKKDRFFGLFEKLRQPDITGQQLLWGYPVMTGSAGALGYAGGKLHPINASLSDETTETYSDITFAASRSVATFGKAETVQPSAIRLLAIIRT